MAWTHTTGSAKNKGVLNSIGIKPQERQEKKKLRI